MSIIGSEFKKKYGCRFFDMGYKCSNYKQGLNENGSWGWYWFTNEENLSLAYFMKLLIRKILLFFIYIFYELVKN